MEKKATATVARINSIRDAFAKQRERPAVQTPSHAPGQEHEGDYRLFSDWNNFSDFHNFRDWGNFNNWGNFGN